MFSPDDNYLFFAGSDRHINQMDLKRENIVKSFKAHNDTVTGLIFETVETNFILSVKTIL